MKTSHNIDLILKYSEGQWRMNARAVIQARDGIDLGQSGSLDEEGS